MDTGLCSTQYKLSPIDPQGRHEASSSSPFIFEVLMPLRPDKTSLNRQEKRLRKKLDRDVAPRVVLTEACNPQNSKPLILCIDDDGVQLELRKQILENDGFLVLNATTAEEAIHMLRETPVCLVLSDHMLGGTTGTQLAADLKKVKPEVPVVLYSGRSPESLQNVDCFIAKSEPVPQFLAMIRDLMNRYWA